jgi:hypothetical protein
MFEIVRKELFDSLEPLQGLIKKGSDKEEQSGIITYHRGRFYTKAVDHKATTLAPKVFKDNEVDTFSVNGDLLSFLQKTTADTVSFELGKMLEVKAKKAKAQFAFKDDQGIKLKGFTFTYPKEWEVLGDSFISSFEKVSKVASKELSRPALASVHISEKQMEATDGKRYFQLKSDESFLNGELLIPATSFQFIQSLSAKKYCVEDNQVFFKNESGLIGGCPLYGGTFPNASSMMKIEGHIIKLSKSIHEAVSRCCVFTDRSRFEEEKTFLIKIQDNTLHISVESPFGSCEEYVKAQYPIELEGRSFKVNPNFFIECLSHGLKRKRHS